MKCARANRDPRRRAAEPMHSVARLLLSHHPPAHENRTVTLGWGSYRARVCCRCLGLTLGLLGSWVFLACYTMDRTPSVLVVSWLLLAPWPAIADFHGQMMGMWESTNLRRMVTGALFGACVCLGMGQALRGHWASAVIMPLVVGIYLGWVVAGRRRGARLLRHLRLYAAYYDRCRAEDARRAVCRAARKSPRIEDSHTPDNSERSLSFT